MADDEEKFMFTKEQVDKSSTILEGWPPEKERYTRQLCATMIQEMGQKLSLSQLGMNTAIVYMHRFYMFQSMQQFNYKITGMACLFLAAKMEEQPRKLEHVAKLGVQVTLHKEALTPVELEGRVREYSEEIKYYENILLQTLGFILRVAHPNTHVIKTCQLIKATKELTQSSYFLATNSVHLSTLCLRYRVTVLACMSIYLACKWSKFEIPLSSEGKPWYYYVDPSVTYELLEEISAEFIDVLDSAPLKAKAKVLRYKDAAANGGQKLSSPADVPPARGPSHGQRVSSHDKTEHAEYAHEAGSDNSDASMRRSRTEPNFHYSHHPSHTSDRVHPPAAAAASAPPRKAEQQILQEEHQAAREQQKATAAATESTMTETSDRLKLIRAQKEKMLNMGVSHAPVKRSREDNSASVSGFSSGSVTAEKTSELLRSSLAPEASYSSAASSQAAAVPQNKSTISLEKYRSRKPPPAPAGPVDKASCAESSQGVSIKVEDPLSVIGMNLAEPAPFPLSLGFGERQANKRKIVDLKTGVPNLSTVKSLDEDDESAVPSLKIKLGNSAPESAGADKQPLKLVISKDTTGTYQKHHKKEGEHRRHHHSKKRSHHHHHRHHITEETDERPAKLPRIEGTPTGSAPATNGSLGVSPVVSPPTPATSSAPSSSSYAQVNSQKVDQGKLEAAKARMEKMLMSQKRTIARKTSKHQK